MKKFVDNNLRVCIGDWVAVQVVSGGWKVKGCGDCKVNALADAKMSPETSTLTECETDKPLDGDFVFQLETQDACLYVHNLLETQFS